MPKTTSPKGRAASLCLALALALLALLPAVAHAVVGAGMSISFPPTVTVGQSGVPASLTLQNQNTGSELTATNTVCNADDSSGMCGGTDTGIVLTASCAALDDGRCTAADPGVFAFPATATGRDGTSCEGTSFAIDHVDPTFGTVRFTPAGGGHVTLPRIVAGCAIDFTLSVLRSPAADADPATPGVQTARSAEHTQYTPGVASARALASGASTVLRAPTTIVATAPAEIAGGQALAASAAVSGRVDPGGATIDFRLHGPDDPLCVRTPVFSSLGVPYPPAGGSVSSAAFSPTAAGTYRWSASYSGDANNLPADAACGAATVVASVDVRDRDRDGTPDAADKCPAVAGDKANGCPRNLDADIRGVWRVNGLLSKLVSLAVRAPVGSRIAVRCKGPERACSFKSRVVRKTTKSVTGLTKSFRSPRIFPSGTRITVFVTKALRRGTYERVQTRSGRRLPSVVNRCLNARLEVQLCPP